MIYVVRHGQTEWSKTHRHTGRTDIPLTAEGEEQARALGPRLQRDWALVLASPLQRAWRTAELAGLRPTAAPDLMEWDYGYAEGRTTAELSSEQRWRVWEAEGLGESLAQVAERVRRVLAAVPAEGDTCLVAHGHVLRVLTAGYLGLDPVQAKHLVLEPARIGLLGQEHDWPALQGWNL